MPELLCMITHLSYFVHCLMPDLLCATEKGELMVRNAQLSQQLTSVQQQLTQQQGDAELQLTDRDQTIQGQEDSIMQLNSRLAMLEKQVGTCWTCRHRDIPLLACRV